MKQTRNVTIFCVLLCLAWGCASPREQWAVADRGLREVTNVLTATHKAGGISDKDFIATEPYALAARGTLKQADAELIANNEKPTDKFNFYLGLTTTTVSQLQKYKVITTQPTR